MAGPLGALGPASDDISLGPTRAVASDEDDWVSRIMVLGRHVEHLDHVVEMYDMSTTYHGSDDTRSTMASGREGHGWPLRAFRRGSRERSSAAYNV